MLSIQVVENMAKDILKTIQEKKYKFLIKDYQMMIFYIKYLDKYSMRTFNNSKIEKIQYK